MSLNKNSIMKYLLLSLFLFCNTIVFGQTKADLLDCLEVIFEQDEFQIAFENEIRSNGALVIEINPKKWHSPNKSQELKSELTQDDFYDFDRPVEIFYLGNRENGDLPKQYYLDFNFGGDEKNLRFILNTVTREDNLYRSWVYNLTKNDEEWEIEGRNLTKRKYK